MPFVKSTNPDDFFENASLTLAVVEIKGSEKIKYRVVFSDPPLILKSPLNLVELDAWLSVSLVGYVDPEDFTYTLSYLEATSVIDIELSAIKDIKETDLIVKVIDKAKITNHKGKSLENSEFTFKVSPIRKKDSIVSESAVKSLKSVTSISGGILASGSSTFLTFSALMGISMSFLAKFFQVIEFTGMVIFFNVKFDPILQKLL